MGAVAGALTGQDEGVNPRAFDVGAQQPAAPGPAARPVSAIATPPSAQPSAPQAKPQPSTAAASPDDAENAHHTMVGRLFSSVRGALGGGGETSYERDASGKMVATTEPSTPGQWAKNIIAGVLTGMAAGANAPRGSGPFGAIGAGGTAVMQQRAEQDKAAREEADKDFATQRKTAMENAQMAMLTQQTAAATWDLKDKQLTRQFQLAEQDRQFAAHIASNPENRDLGTYGSFDEMLAAHKADIPGLQKEFLSGNVWVYPAVDKDGKVTGTHFAIVKPSWKDQPTTEDMQFSTFKPPDKPDGKPTITTHTIPAGSLTNFEAAQVVSGSTAPMLTWSHQQEEERQGQERVDLEKKQIEKQGEVTPAMRFAQANENYRAQLAASAKNGGSGELQSLSDPFGDPLGKTTDGEQLNRKEYDAAGKTFSKEYIQPLNTLHKTLLEFQRIDANKNQTGAEKVTALLAAVGISGDPLKGKGFRITNDVIKEHANSRNVWEGAVARLNTIAGSGGPITSKQIADYRAVAQGVVRDAYVSAAQEAKRQGLPKNFLPQAIQPNQVPDPLTLRIYLDVAGGDVDRAHKALVKAGYAP